MFPFVTIRNVHVQGSVDSKEKRTEVLATGEHKVNERARKIADEYVQDFAYDLEYRVIVDDPMLRVLLGRKDQGLGRGR